MNESAAAVYNNTPRCCTRRKQEDSKHKETRSKDFYYTNITDTIKESKKVSTRDGSGEEKKKEDVNCVNKHKHNCSEQGGCLEKESERLREGDVDDDFMKSIRTLGREGGSLYDSNTEEQEALYDTVKSSSGGSSTCEDSIIIKHSSSSSRGSSQLNAQNNSIQLLLTSHQNTFLNGNLFYSNLRIALAKIRTKYKMQDIRIAKTVHQLADSFLQLEKIQPALGLEVNLHFCVM
jgi:hypothetical protein